MPRPKRQCTTKPASPQKNIWSQDKWTIHEKKALLAAIKMNGTDDVEKFRRYLPGRTLAEIRKQLDRYTLWAKTKYGRMRRMRAPIEFWNCQVAFLTENLHELSSLLSRVMSIAANMEPRPQPSNNVPDYSAIYRCISELMTVDQLDNLGQREALVMLSLFQDMAKHLHSLDFEKQRVLMLKKFRALSQYVDLNTQSSQESFYQIMHGLQQDLTESDLKKHAEQKATSLPSSDVSQNQTAIKQDVTSPQLNNGGSCQSEEKGVASTSGAEAETQLSGQAEEDSNASVSQAELDEVDILSTKQDLNELSLPTQPNLGQLSSPQSSSSKGAAEACMSQPSTTTQPCSSATASSSTNPPSASTLAQDVDMLDEDKLPQHAPLYSLNPLCIPIKYLQPRMRPMAPSRSTAQISTGKIKKNVDIPEEVIQEAFKKGLIKVGDVIKVKVVQQPNGSNKVILEKDNKFPNKTSAPQNTGRSVPNKTSPPQKSEKSVPESNIQEKETMGTTGRGRRATRIRIKKE